MYIMGVKKTFVSYNQQQQQNGHILPYYKLKALGTKNKKILIHMKS